MVQICQIHQPQLLKFLLYVADLLKSDQWSLEVHESYNEYEHGKFQNSLRQLNHHVFKYHIKIQKKTISQLQEEKHIRSMGTNVLNFKRNLKS